MTIMDLRELVVSADPEAWVGPRTYNSSWPAQRVTPTDAPDADLPAPEERPEPEPPDDEEDEG